jgi:hypothetical protein
MSESRPTPIPRFFEPDRFGLLRFLAARIDLGDWDAFVDRYTAPPAVRDPETAEEMKALVRSDFMQIPKCSNGGSDGLLCLPGHLEAGDLPIRTDPRVFEAFSHALLMLFQLECGQYAPEYVSPRLIVLCGELGPECLALCGRFVCGVLNQDGTEWNDPYATEMFGEAAVLLLAARLAFAKGLELSGQRGVRSIGSELFTQPSWRKLLASLEAGVQEDVRRVSPLFRSDDSNG